MMKNTLLFTLVFFCCFSLPAQNTGDFRTAGHVTFAASTNWETFNGSSWVSASGAPDHNDGLITITSGHTATVNADVTLDQIIVYGNLIITGSPVNLTLADGTGTDLIVQSGGSVTMSVGASGGWAFSGSSSWQVQSGGSYIHNSARAITAAFANAILESGSTFIYRYSGTYPATTFAGKTYANLTFESTSGTYSDNFNTGSNPLTVNGNLSIGSNVEWSMGSFTGDLNFNGNVSISGAFSSHSFEIASGKTLTINSGGVLEINPGETVTITGSLVNDHDASGIVLKSDANGTAELIHSGSVAGTVERYIPVSSTAIQHFISSPVSGAKISSILDNGLGNYNAYAYDPSMGGSIHDKWDRVYGTDDMVFGKAYTIPYAHASTTSKTISFSGNMHATSNSVSVSNSDGAWNLLGNPFTAPLAVSSFLAANSSAIYGAVYYLDDNGAPYYSTDYAVHNGSGSTRSGANSKAGQAYIGLGQGFFVESNGGGSSVTFNPAWRTGGQNPLFFANGPDPIQRFYLSVSNEQGAYNEILIGFTDFASKGFDNLYDAHKLKGNPALSLYSLISDSDEEFAIQGRPYVMGCDTIGLGLDANLGGVYHFCCERSEHCPDHLKMFLLDRNVNQYILLDEQTLYSVDLEAGNYRDRFVLLFSNDDLPSVRAKSRQTKDHIRINGSTIIVSASIHNSEVSMLDILGRKIKSWRVNEDDQRIDLSDYKGCYIFYLNIGDQNLFTKKIILP